MIVTKSVYVNPLASNFGYLLALFLSDAARRAARLVGYGHPITPALLLANPNPRHEWSGRKAWPPLTARPSGQGRAKTKRP